MTTATLTAVQLTIIMVLSTMVLAMVLPSWAAILLSAALGLALGRLARSLSN